MAKKNRTPKKAITKKPAKRVVRGKTPRTDQSPGIVIRRQPVPATATKPLPPLPAGYADLLAELKERIGTAQVKAALAVNRELIQLYWEIGRAIVDRQRTEGWGRSVVERLSGDLRREFPHASGLSPQNLWYMRSFYLAWTTETKTTAAANLQQPVGETGTHPPPAVAAIPWGHNLQLLAKVQEPAERLWYAQQTILHGWSRSVLVMQIESRAYARQGQAITNFASTLPAPQSDLAQQLLKDPYTFDFLTIAADAREREIENALLAHLKEFLIALGKGFAFVGSQYPLEVGGEEFFVDLLFYHLHLRCFVVIDLKTEPFKPEFAGKMNFYVAAIDDQLRHATDQPTIGVILCKERNRVIVEFALRDQRRPLGVATYEFLPEAIKSNLPTPAELEAELLRHDIGGDDDII